MSNYFKRILFFILLFSFSAYPLLSQFTNSDNNDDKFFLDVVVFKGNPEPLGRVDFFVAVPYKNLVFSFAENLYSAKYTITLELIDSTGKSVKVYHNDKTVNENEYFIAQGGSAEADFTQNIFFVQPGKYTARATIRDRVQNQEYQKSRTINVINFSDYPFSISGILLVSSIEESNNKFKITPYIADNIANLPSSFFAFFEVYNGININDVDFIYEIADKESDKVYFKSDVINKNISDSTSQEFITIKQPELLKTGKYILRIIALRPGAIKNEEQNYLAVAQRTIQYVQSLGGIVKQDLDKAIQQLAYIASDKEMDYIEEAATNEQKLVRFEEFWRKKDPSPGTQKNEAFVEYYNRIQKANEVFSTYTDGWMTDRGMVYVIYGPPYNIERGRNYSNGTIYEKWVYMSNREFLFADQSGFGDFRLIRPYAINERYTYGR